jgi:hypothetical protein
VEKEDVEGTFFPFFLHISAEIGIFAGNMRREGAIESLRN